MQLPLQITFRDIPRSDAITAAIQEKVDKLELFHNHIMSCRVSVEAPQKHKHQGKEFSVGIDIKTPGKEVVVKRHRNEDIYVAIRDAFDAAHRQLEEHGQRRRGSIKTHEEVLYGRIARLLGPEYGFIEDAEGREFYFTPSNLLSDNFSALEIDMPVHFIAGMGDEGPQANRVTVNPHSVE